MARYRYMGIDLQSVWGSKVTVFEYLDPVSASINPDNQILVKEGVGSRDPRISRMGPYRLSGSMNSFADGDIFGYLLYGALGTTDMSTAYDAAYEHLFWGADELPFYTLELGMDGDGSSTKARELNSCVVNSLNIEAVAGELMTWNADLICQTELLVNASYDPTTDQFADENEMFVYHQGQFTLAGDAGSAVKDVSAFRISIENNVNDSLFYLGSRFLGDGQSNEVVPPVGARKITGSIDIPFETTAALTEYKRFLGAAAATAPADTSTPERGYLVVNGDATITGGSEPYRFWMYWPKMEYMTADLSVSGRDPITLTINFQCLGVEWSNITDGPATGGSGDPYFSAAGNTEPADYEIVAAMAGLVNGKSVAYDDVV